MGDFTGCAQQGVNGGTGFGEKHGHQPLLVLEHGKQGVSRLGIFFQFT